MSENKPSKPILIDRNEINRKLDKIRGSIDKWLDEKKFLEAEMLAKEGMFEHPDVDYWTED